MTAPDGDEVEDVDTVGVVSYYVRGNDYTARSESESRRVDRSTEIVESIKNHLESQEVTCLLNQEAADSLDEEGVAVSTMADQADVVVTVGGDGTVLRALGAMSPPVPVLGVNTGRVGFLADVEPEDAVEAVDVALDGFQVERRGRLSVEVNGEPLPPALNETVIVTSRPAKIMAFDVFHDGEEVESMRSDGVVVATPTGSTAYSMSAGGPLVDPRVDAKLVVPLAPFRINVAPWVVGMDGETTVVPTRIEKNASVVVDGADLADVGRGDEVTFGRAEHDALFVDTGLSFFERVQNKLY